MKKLALILVLFFSPCLFAADPVANYIKLPEKINIEKTRVKDLQIDTNIKNLLWFCEDKRLEVIQINEKRAILQGMEDATIYINFFYAEDNVVKGPFKLTVVIGKGTPAPNPNPPDPVPPEPVPGPSTEFEKAVAAAYASDTVTKDKLTQKTTLITFYKTAIKNVINDKDLDTRGKLVGVLSLTAKEAMGDNLVPVRKEIQKYLDSKLGKESDTKMTDELRSSHEKEFNNVILALEKI